MAITRGEQRQLAKIFRDVMDRFEYKTDQERWGRLEHWESDTTLFEAVQRRLKISGDCEEAARAFMVLALGQGFQARLIAGYDEKGQGHCWCEVADTDFESAIYLDNRQPAPVSLKGLTGYRAVMASPWNPVPGDIRPWLQLK